MWEAVTTLEETARTARRVLGGAHPTTKAIEAALERREQQSLFPLTGFAGLRGCLAFGDTELALFIGILAGGTALYIAALGVQTSRVSYIPRRPVLRRQARTPHSSESQPRTWSMSRFRPIVTTDGPATWKSERVAVDAAGGVHERVGVRGAA